MNISVNGVSRQVSSPPLTSLLQVLREDMGILSPKAGCEAGGCGACTVLIDREPRRSCLIPVGSLDGAEITTAEGLGTPENPSLVQQAFIHHYAAQCGFCTPGMIVAATAYLEGGRGDDREAIQEALGGHMCRCTGYRKIIDAVAAAARQHEFDLTTTTGSENTIIKVGSR